MSEVTVGSVGGGGASPSLRDALEYELNMIESSIEAFENEVEALNALIDWHVSVAVDPKVNGGWQLVPKESTEAMLNQGESEWTPRYEANRVYHAMLAAAPKYKGEK